MSSSLLVVVACERRFSSSLASLALQGDSAASFAACVADGLRFGVGGLTVEVSRSAVGTSPNSV